jgi:hypothetical protein
MRFTNHPRRVSRLSEHCCFLPLALLFLVYAAPPTQANGLDTDGDNLITVKDLLFHLQNSAGADTISDLLFMVADSWNAPPPGETFDFKDYFPVSGNTFWHYIDFNGATGEDHFKWTVQAGMLDPGSGKTLVPFLTETDEPTDDRNGDKDFYYVEPDGQVFFYGTFLATAHGSLQSQTIILTDPLLIGRNGLMVGDQIIDTGAGNVTVSIPFPPFSTTLPGTLTATVDYTEVIPSFSTPLGNFTQVLRVVIDMDITVTVFGSPFTLNLKNNTFLFKKNIGMVAQDQHPDPDDAQVQAINEGQVAGVPIVAN